MHFHQTRVRIWVITICALGFVSYIIYISSLASRL